MAGCVFTPTLTLPLREREFMDVASSLVLTCNHALDYGDGGYLEEELGD